MIQIYAQNDYPALGSFQYKDWNFVTHFDENDRLLQMFNDMKFIERPHKREHLIYMSCTVVAKVSESVLPPEARKWVGERSIALCKNKRKEYRFIGRESIDQEYGDLLINHKLGSFRGSEEVAVNPPEVPLKMWPLKCALRTYFA